MPRRRQVFAGLSDTGDADDPFAGSAFYGGTDTFYDENPNFVYQPDPGDTGLINQFINKFNDAVAQLDQKVSELNDAENRLLAVQSIAQQNPDDAAAWQSEYNKVDAINSTITTAQNTVAQLQSWWDSAKSTIGLSGASSLAKMGLGALPFAIPWALIAGITAAVAAIAAVIASVNSLVDRINLKNWNDENIRRSQQGLAPLPKPDTYGQSIFGDISDLGRTLTFAAIAYFLLPPLLKKLERQ